MSAIRRSVSMTLATATVVMIVAGCGSESRSTGQGAAVTQTADGVSIAYEVHGDGTPTLVLVHGWSCDRSYWDLQVDAFSVDHRVVTVDLAGHGASGTERSAWTIENFAHDVAAVTEALDVRDVILVGHSLGGPVVLEAALLAPDRIAAVVGVDAFFDVWQDSVMIPIVDRLRADFPTEARAFVRGMFLPTSEATLVDSIVNDMAAAPPEIAMAALDELLVWAKERQDEAVATLEPPIGLIMADGSVAQTTRFQAARGAAPLLGVEEVPNAGHFVMQEAPEAFNTRLRAMLAAVTAR